jgi:hypothetical protein
MGKEGGGQEYRTQGWDDVPLRLLEDMGVFCEL